MNTTHDLVEFISTTYYPKIPSSVIKAAKKHIIDTLGSIIYSSDKEWSKKVVSFISNLSLKGKCTVITYNLKTVATTAALANGTMGHGFEVDDVHEIAKNHPGAVVIPAALAICEHEEISGCQFLEAVILGYEVMCRIGVAVNPQHHILKGFHATGTSGPFGSVVAVGKALNLNKNELVNALGIAGSFSSGLMQFSQEKSGDGGMVKRLHAGKAAHDGLVAALLAKENFKGPSDIIDGKFGFLNVYSDKALVNLLNKDLGINYEILNVGIKAYPCCRTLHPVIDAIKCIKIENNIIVKDIQEIEVYGNEKLVTYHSNLHIGSVMAAQYSAPFCTALAILGLAKNPENFTPEMARKKEIIKIMGRTKLYQGSNLEEGFSVIIKLRGGKTVKKNIKYEKGHPNNEMKLEEVCEKFKTLTQGKISLEKQDRIIKIVLNIEEISKISELTRVLN